MVDKETERRLENRNQRAHFAGARFSFDLSCVVGTGAQLSVPSNGAHDCGRQRREREAAVAVECTAVECSGVAVASSRRVEATFSFLLSK